MGEEEEGRGGRLLTGQTCTMGLGFSLSCTATSNTSLSFVPTSTLSPPQHTLRTTRPGERGGRGGGREREREWERGKGRKGGEV